MTTTHFDIAVIGGGPGGICGGYSCGPAWPECRGGRA